MRAANMDACPVYFRLHGVSLTQIGLLSLIGLAWTLNGCGPQRWTFGRVTSLDCVVSGFPLPGYCLFSFHRSSAYWTLGSGASSSCWRFGRLPRVSRLTPTVFNYSTKKLGPGNGIRVATDRIALIPSGGLFVAVGGFFGWMPAFGGEAALLGGSALLLFWRLPRPTPHSLAQGASIQERILTPFWDLLRREGLVIVAIFILTFKLGDMALGPMVRPFWVDRECTPVQIGMVPGTIGVITAILGALWGGTLTAKWGIY